MRPHERGAGRWSPCQRGGGGAPPCDRTDTAPAAHAPGSPSHSATAQRARCIVVVIAAVVSVLDFASATADAIATLRAPSIVLGRARNGRVGGATPLLRRVVSISGGAQRNRARPADAAYVLLSPYRNPWCGGGFVLVRRATHGRCSRAARAGGAVGHIMISYFPGGLVRCSVAYYYYFLGASVNYAMGKGLNASFFKRRKRLKC